MTGPRRVAAILTVLATAVACACAPGRDADSDGGGRPVVLTTFTVLADIAANVAGEHLQVESITKPGAEIHGYEPTPGDIKKAARADLILDNGLNLEAWFAQFVDDIDVPHVVLSDGIEPISISADAYAGLPNPHAWMSPLNVQVYADNAAAAFAVIPLGVVWLLALVGAGAKLMANAARYRAELQRVQDDLVDRLRAVPNSQRALVTCEGAFSYLARDTGLTEKYIWPVNAEQQATPQQIASTIDFVAENTVPAVFCESTVSDAPMQRVVEATGARYGGTLYVDSLSAADGPVPTYLELIRHDADTIAAALTASRTP